MVAAAFMDDLILLSGSYDGLQALLGLVQDFYGFIGGEVVPHKSYWFTTASDETLGELDMSLDITASRLDKADAGMSTTHKEVIVGSLHSWCEELSLVELEYAGGADLPLSAHEDMRVTLHFP